MTETEDVLAWCGDLQTGGRTRGGSANVLCVAELDAGLSTENPGLDIPPDAYAHMW